ncbi:MAG TPA: CHAT domain-containing protein [Terracidiphilus sp.]|nr:CHAT domain-containing protein [Terracidiphilus sp.]
MSWLDDFGRVFLRRRFSTLWLAVVLLLCMPLQDLRSVEVRTAYENAFQLFQHGQLEQCQRQAEQSYASLVLYNPEWASRFRLLQAEALEWRGMYDQSLQVARSYRPLRNDPESRIRQLSIEGIAFAREHEWFLADQTILEAEGMCKDLEYAACGDVLRARGIFQSERGRFSLGEQSYLEALAFARSRRDHLLEASASLNLAWIALQVNHFDEAVDWSESAYRASIQLGDKDLTEKSAGNLGWAYLGLGDFDRALALFREAEQQSVRLGNTRDELKWLTTVGYVYQDTGELAGALEPYHRALVLATELNSKEDIITSLELLSHLSIETGKLNEASSYLQQLDPLVRATENRLDDLDVMLAHGEIAAARHQDQQAEAAFRLVENDPESQISMRLGAEHELAKLYEGRGNLLATDHMYQSALLTFEKAREQLKNEDSKLPFLANATPIYDDYIHMLVAEGKVDQALAVADHSRARTLAQGLGLDVPVQPAALHATEIARKANATLLFYWLGQTQSYLWAITPSQIHLFPLPAKSEITATVDRYRNALLGPDDVLASSNGDGRALYQMLIAPAGNLIPPGSNVVILGDGALTQLNFETLIVPPPHPHFWIEDATLVSAPSLYMLASAKTSSGLTGKALLLGDALSPDPDYPQLPKASVEMRRIERHFAAGQKTVFAREMANPAAYMASNPQQYAYIHFVAHGVASVTDPLDSAIILSRANSTDDSFKLYARDIIQRPLHARLVTISSCYGGGTRSYAGEGLVGLSWAFLRAGAHNVIGALWEVSDDSTPALMDSLYQGLEQGLPPSSALRKAKLAMLHGSGSFRSPFFWAPFQIYTGL